ncbi:hypothetical protein INT47_002115 [Mucor saturninus]|uniref:Uncharacterized protein n=1 Tax=Mucor saturninus TaxID=64648 RepID=A0A8H7R0N3_9FUNG|nr:hypothetical protein INT47_002115 [Mucor saturninus]
MDNSQQVLKLRFNNNITSSGEFTRRKNWSQSILESVRDVIHVLSPDLRFVYCSTASSEFLGYKPSELVQHLFTEFIHVDDIDMFVRDFRTANTAMQTLRTTYRFLRKDGKYTTLETRGRFYKGSFFGNARRIPTEAAHSIDSFLDLKMENELLKKKLEALKGEHKRGVSMDSEHTSSSNPGSMTNVADEDTNSSDEYDDCRIPSNGSHVYTQGVTSNYDISESVSLFTGLRYDLGERSVGISMGLHGGELTMIGMDQIMDHSVSTSTTENMPQRSLTPEPRAGKKKRLNPSAEVAKVCTDCGITEAPEWRRGPNGPKTLCNACGLRWSKSKKKLENQMKSGNAT